MKLIRDEAGQTVVFTGLLMCVLMGFMALAVDVGLLSRAQRRLQIAADAGAVAAGLASEYGMTVTGCGVGVSNVQCAAIKAANANGVKDATQVTVTQPPTYGTHTGPAYIEVIIKQPNPTVFMGTFAGLFYGGANTNYNAMTVGARAVSGIVPGQVCVYALDKTAHDSFDLQGTAQISVPNCTIQINSSQNDALCTTGGNADVISEGIFIVGAQDGKGKCNKTQANAVTGVEPLDNPLANLPSPTCTTGAGGNTFSVGGSNPIISSATQLSNSAGTKVNFAPTTQTVGSGPTATTASVVCFSDANLTIASGLTLGSSGGNEIFVFQNGVTLTGTTTINGTLDIAGGDFSQGNTALSITAPTNTSYTYNGIGLMVPATNTSITCGNSLNSFKGTPAPGGCLQIQFGSGSGNLDGMIYAPAAQVYMQDNGGGNVVTAIIADEIYDKSSSLEITNNYNYVHTTSPLNHVALVE